MDYEIFKLYKEKLNLKAVDVQTTSPLILAYIGDCLYDLAVREYMVSNFPGVVNAVNQKKTTFVCAHAQSEIMGYLIGQGVLTDEEMSVYRRGRNQKLIRLRLSDLIKPSSIQIQMQLPHHSRNRNPIKSHIKTLLFK